MKINEEKNPMLCVNALSGLYLISTTDCIFWYWVFSKVSMPSRAYTSFLLWRIGKESFIHISVSVNALSSLYLISTLHLLSGSEIISFGVNALSGLYLISTKGKKGARNGLRISVNALSGLYLISTYALENPRRNISGCVNALSGLYLISTDGDEKKKAVNSLHRVNALSGLYLIST